MHPNLTINRDELAACRAAAPSVPALGQALRGALQEGAAALATSTILPGPGGASSKQQKENDQLGNAIRRLGLAYQLTSEDRYAAKARDLLLAYAQQYPTLPRNPAGTTKSRLYWQSLDEAVWMTNLIQGYDFVYESTVFSTGDHATIERNLLRPGCAIFLEDDKTVDRTNNWATWACAAVAMVGYTIGDLDLVDQALRGTKRDGRRGYLWQLDALFSPEGWYEEGPSYATYALLPFFYVAEAVERHQPERSVYTSGDGILARSILALAQAAYPHGDYPALNDSPRPGGNVSQLGWRAEAAYHRAAQGRAGNVDPEALLAVAARSSTRSVTAAGLAVAQALAARPQPPRYAPQPIELSDGPTGGLGILRLPPEGGPQQTMALMKYGQLGGGHGHYDKLELLLYAGGQEALTDYGFVRFVGVEAKDGGKYLPENDSYGRQTVAHNTVVVDERRQSEGRHPNEANNATKRWFDASHEMWQVVSATADTVYPGVAMERTIALVQPAPDAPPLLLDCYRLRSATPHRYDYVLHPLGDLAGASLPLEPAEGVAGEANGYQHLALEQRGTTAGGLQFTWTRGQEHYTATMAAGSVPYELLIARLGANDPNDNLRHEPAWLVRADGAAGHTFAACFEGHGLQEQGSVTQVRLFAQTDDATGIVVEAADYRVRWLIAHGPADPAAAHALASDGATWTWTGPIDVRIERSR